MLTASCSAALGFVLTGVAVLWAFFGRRGGGLCFEYVPKRSAIKEEETMDKMNKLYLEHLAFICEVHHDNGTRFDLDGWCYEHIDHLDGWCGTKACAVGHALIDPYFNKAGLYRFSGGDPGFEGFRSWDAVTRFFGISEAAALWLFHMRSYPITKGDAAARAVARRIRKFVAGGEKIVPKRWVDEAKRNW
jgi:hypothetical protein